MNPSPTARLLHRYAGAFALAILFVFQTSTLIGETLLSHAGLVVVKDAIVWGLAPLIACLATAGITGNAIARKPLAGLVQKKANRMKLAAANGLIILVPAALWLDRAVNLGDMGAGFYVVQALEIAAGLVNVTLLGLNMRDGLLMTRKKRAMAKAAAQ